MTIPELKAKFKKFLEPSNYLEFIEVAENTGDKFRCYLYTTSYRYHIVAHDDSGGNYLGCTCSCRTPLPGENHTRGSDLADGKLTEETFNEILIDIVRNELCKLSEYALRTKKFMWI